MQTSSFNSLQTNLYEIYAAISSESQGQSLALYATSPSAVYYQNSLMGKMVEKWDKTWRWIFPSAPLSVDHIVESIVTTLFNQAVHQAYSMRQHRIWHHMQLLDEAWKSQLQPQAAIDQQNRYTDYLSQELKGSIEEKNPIFMTNFKQRRMQALDENELGNLRHTVINFHEATYDFWHAFVKNENKEEGEKKKETLRIRKSLMRFLKPSSILKDRVLFKALKKEGRWVQMESKMCQPIPVALLSKLHDPSTLTMAETRQLKEWVHALNQHSEEISLHLLSEILIEVMTIIRIQGSSSVTLQDILYWMDQQGCPILYQEDPKHMDEREALSPGKMIICNGQQLTLGKLLSPDKDVNDRYKVFELANDPDCVVKIACNHFLLLIEEKRSQNEQEHWGVRFVETKANLEKDPQKPVIKGLDQEGRCVVLEKLFPAFENHTWTTQDFRLTKGDEKLALVFASHMFCMAEWKAFSQNLSLSHLMWDKDGVLKSTRLLKREPFNYNVLEEYCKKCAKGNPFILSFLMNVSKLSEHDIARYYRGAVEHALTTGKTDLIGRDLPLGHRQDEYNEQTKKLCAQAIELRESCIKLVVAQLRKQNCYSHKQVHTVQQAVIDKLMLFYRASPTAGSFSPQLQEDVVASYFSSSAQPLTVMQSLNAQKYYREQHEFMMKSNQAILKQILIHPII